MAGRPKSSAERRAAAIWAAYLKRGLDRRGWQQRDLIRAAGKRADGKYILNSGRVSQWVNGHEAASPEYAVVVARAFGDSESEALRAIVPVDITDDEAATTVSATAPDNDEAFVARLRSSSDPEMHKLANQFEADLERVRRLTRLELAEIQRKREDGESDGTDANISIDKSA